MRRAKATPVDLAAWAQSTKENPHRQSLNHRLSTHVARQAPAAPTQTRTSSSRTGSVSSERGPIQSSRSSIVAPPAQPAQSRPSQAQTLRMPSERQGSISGPSNRQSSISSNRLHTPDGSESGDYERRNTRDERKSNGLVFQGQSHSIPRNQIPPTIPNPAYLASLDKPESLWDNRK